MKFFAHPLAGLLSLTSVFCLSQIPVHAQYAGPVAGQKVAFLGDSITCFGTNPGGWVNLVSETLEKDGRKIVVIQKGLPGNTAQDMLGRIGDVLSYKPDWMTLSCGVNDVWRNGLGLDDYKKDVTAIVDQATAAGVKVVILTPTMIGETTDDPNNIKLAPYIAFLKEFSAQRHLLVADLHSDMETELAAVRAKNPKLSGTLLTLDSVHMNGAGNEMMAAGVLKAFGYTDAELAKIRETWLDLPSGVPLRLVQSLTPDQYVKLRAIAAERGQTVDEMLAADLAKKMQDRLTAPSPAATPTKP